MRQPGAWATCEAWSKLLARDYEFRDCIPSVLTKKSDYIGITCNPSVGGPVNFIRGVLTMALDVMGRCSHPNTAT